MSGMTRRSRGAGWEFDDDGLMLRRIAIFNGAPIREVDRNRVTVAGGDIEYRFLCPCSAKLSGI